MNMKLSLVFCSMIALGCAGKDPGPYQPQLDEAAAAWARDKPSCTTYHYLRATTSFTESVTETAIEISNDRPSRRRYVGHYVQDDGRVITEAWDETGAAIGSHEGFPAQTVEQLFVDCREALDQDPVKNELTLRIGAHGVPAACTFVPHGCADDCLMGLTVSDFACGPLP